MVGRISGRNVGPRKHFVDVVDQLRERFRFAVTRLRQVNLKISADVAGIPAQDDNAIGQQHRLFNVVGHDEDGLSGHCLLGPQLQKFTAQILGGEHVERGKRLVHEEHFRFNDEGARETHALPHAAGKFLRISSLEAVESDHVQHLHASFAARIRFNAARLQRGLDIFQHGEPWKQSKALEDDRDVNLGLRDGPSVPEDLAGRRR